MTFAAESEVDPAELHAMAELVIADGGGRILPRIIRYIEERHVHERRWTGAIEQHPSPLHVIWGDRDPVAVWPMAERIGERRAPTRRWCGSTAWGITRWSRTPPGSTRRSQPRSRSSYNCDAIQRSTAGPLSKLEISA